MLGIDNLKQLSTRIFNDFNHNTRKWTQKIYTNKQLIKLLSKDLIQETENYVFYPDIVEDTSNLIVSYPNFNQHNMYDILRNLEVGSNTIQFIMYGFLSRDAGQFISINAGLDDAKSTFNGLWTIYSCRHIWDSKTYTNDIVCFRTKNNKNLG